jgi:hypothetical protein
MSMTKLSVPSICLMTAIAVLTCGGTAAPEPPSTRDVKLPSKDKLHLYLLMGQSNMAGRGVVGPEDKTPHPRVLMLSLDGKWEPAAEPVTRDRAKGLGVGPGLAFGKAMAEHDPDVTIGLIPCAVGGTALAKWQKGEKLYEDAVKRARLAMQVGTLKGVLWHQGESEAGDEAKASSYDARLAKMINDLRKDLGAPELPVVAGQIGEFLYNRTGNKSPFAKRVNERIAQLPARLEHAGFVSSHGLNHKGDELHFDTAAQHELGKRFAAEMIRLQANGERH